MLRSFRSHVLALQQGGTSLRAIHTTAISSGRRLSNRKAELKAQREAEIEAHERAKEELRKLKDTKFLNSLVHPERLFQSTQISQKEAAISSSLAFQSKSGGAMGDAKDFEAGLKRKADSGAYAYRIEPADIELITEVAPKATADVGIGHTIMLETINKNKDIQMDTVRRIAALDNANAKAVTKHNVQRAVETFGRSEEDSGSPEVQAAVWTIRINSLEDHLRTNNKDHQNRRTYTKLLHKRAKMLKYLKRESLERYYLCLKQLGLTKGMVEGEILIPKRVE